MSSHFKRANDPWRTPLKVLIILIALVVTGTVVALLLTGCSSPNTQEPVRIDTTNSDIEERHITLNDGRQVVCIEVNIGQSGGIDCDWANASGIVE